MSERAFQNTLKALIEDSEQTVARKNPNYMIPLDFPLERYIYAPDPTLAHWTSYPDYSYQTFVRNNPKVRGAATKSRKGLKVVPAYIPKTPRSAGEGVSAIGVEGEWPIGDLYHARAAMVYVMSPSHRAVKRKVISAVKRTHPEYDWDRWLKEHEMRKERRSRSKRAASNPTAHRPVFASPFTSNDSDTRPSFTSNDGVTRRNPADDRMFTISRANPFTPGMFPAAPGQLPPEDVFMPSNAGPYLPDMFPYGVGGRPAVYPNPKGKGKGKGRAKIRKPAKPLTAAEKKEIVKDYALPGYLRVAKNKYLPMTLTLGLPPSLKAALAKRGHKLARENNAFGKVLSGNEIYAFLSQFFERNLVEQLQAEQRAERTRNRLLEEASQFEEGSREYCRLVKQAEKKFETQSRFVPTPVCIWGTHGIGKTTSVQDFCEKNGWRFEYIATAQFEEISDLHGLPLKKAQAEKTPSVCDVYEDEDEQSKNITLYAPPSWVPRQEPPPGKGGILLLDDFNRADTRIIGAIMQLLQNYELFSWRLPNRWQIVLTANPQSSGYATQNLDPAVLTRMLHLTMKFDIDTWRAWAQAPKAGTFRYDAQTYTVQPGDTLESIADSYYGDAHFSNAIRAANKLQSYVLEPGTRLTLPANTLGTPNVDNRAISFISSIREFIENPGMPRTTPRSLEQLFRAIRHIPNWREARQYIRILAASAVEDETQVALDRFIQFGLDYMATPDDVLNHFDDPDYKIEAGTELSADQIGQFQSNMKTVPEAIEYQMTALWEKMAEKVGSELKDKAAADAKAAADLAAQDPTRASAAVASGQAAKKPAVDVAKWSVLLNRILSYARNPNVVWTPDMIWNLKQFVDRDRPKGANAKRKPGTVVLDSVEEFYKDLMKIPTISDMWEAVTYKPGTTPVSTRASAISEAMGTTSDRLARARAAKEAAKAKGNPFHRGGFR